MSESQLNVMPGWWHRVREFLGRIVHKALDDNIFFMAGAITFNLLVAIIPLLVVAVGIAGFMLTARFGDPAAALTELLRGGLPVTGEELGLLSWIEALIDTLVQERTGFSIVGAVVLIWISTRLVGTLRTVLREVFDMPQARGLIRGKVFDIQMVIVAGFLFVVNIGVTVRLRAIRDFGIDLLGLEGSGLAITRRGYAMVVAFASIWVLFVLVYRYLPPRPVPWRTALIAATFTAILFEATKYLFGWYIVSVAEYRSAYGNLTSVAVLFFWIYYGAIVFILGGEVAQVHTMQRTRKLHTAQGSEGRGG
jgi:membrane protein